jgi:hypothetical protein
MKIFPGASTGNYVLPEFFDKGKQCHLYLYGPSNSGKTSWMEWKIKEKGIRWSPGFIEKWADPCLLANEVCTIWIDEP